MVTVGNSGAIWRGAGGLTLSRSWRPFRTAYLRFIIIEHRYSLHSDRYARAAHMNPSFVLFTGSEQSMCKDADIIYSSQTELAGCDEWQIRIKMECECDVIEGRSTRLSFFLFLYYAYSIILNDRLCRIYLFFLCCTFQCVNSKMLN